MQRTVVVGMGHIGHRHARAYTECEQAQLVAVCDRVEELARAAGEKFGVPYFTSAKECYAAMQPDIVSITTGGYEYSSDHYEPTMQAFEAGCNVLGEKPISNDLRHATEMVETAARLGLCYGIDMNHRFTPAARQAKNGRTTAESAASYSAIWHCGSANSCPSTPFTTISRHSIPIP